MAFASRLLSASHFENKSLRDGGVECGHGHVPDIHSIAGENTKEPCTLLSKFKLGVSD